jgi:protein TonB
MRFVVSLVAGVLVALGLFLLMHQLISGAPAIQKDSDDRLSLDFVRVQQDEIENIKERKPPPEPEKPKEPPPPPKLNQPSQDKPRPDLPRMETPRIDVPTSGGGGPYLGQWSAGDPAAEGDVIPIVRIEPQWPREALIEGISGWVLIEFTINEDGSVADPKVVEAEPRRMFERNALRAIYKWKFKPRIVDGQAVKRRATQRIDFNINEAQ